MAPIKEFADSGNQEMAKMLTKSIKKTIDALEKDLTNIEKQILSALEKDAELTLNTILQNQ